jgi:hypothetical protein
MDTLENKAPAQPAPADWREQFNALRHLVVSVMVLLAVVSGTFNLYMWKRWRDVNRELENVRPQADQIAKAVTNLQKVEVPAMQEFVRKMTEYGRTHPDFAPTLAKYNIRPSATPAAPATGAPTSVAPAAAAPQKK